ncbi:hypothetical protein LDENG_00122800 [Lucifuga dentata]|nr:hypothetical protein LDENG_00122800 [Lucifuga dentata]
MAAVDPSESPRRQKSPAEEEETSGDQTEVCSATCSSFHTHEITRTESTHSSIHEHRAKGGFISSHSGVSVEPGAEANKTTVENLSSTQKIGLNTEAACSDQLSFNWSDTEDDDEEEKTHEKENDKRDAQAICEKEKSHPTEKSQEKELADELMGEADKTTVENLSSTQKIVLNTEAACSDQLSFDWSDTEDDDEEEKTHEKENDKHDLNNMDHLEDILQDKHVEANTTSVTDAQVICEKENSHPTEKSQEKELADELMGEANSLEVEEDDEDAGRGEEADLLAKPKKSGLQCKECGKTFNQRETFNLHRHFHAHADELTPLTCKECGLTFQHRSSLIKHRNEHKEKEEQVVTPKKEVCARDVDSFKCAECERFFSTVNKLREHNCSNIPEKPYHCPLCRQEFKYKLSVTKHMKYHSLESIFTCQECYHTFPDSITLRYHQRCHAALKPYECPECGMVFKHYSVMEDHRRKHTDSMRCHVCDICGKSFKYSSLLHQHQYLHTGQKPFRCPECGKNFAFAQNMKAHCRQHRLRETSPLSSDEHSKQTAVAAQEITRGPEKENTNQSEEPKTTYNCPLCKQSYHTPANLRAHMLVHEAEYEKLDRTIRVQKEDGNKNWEKGHACSQCPSIFRDEASLRGHLLKAHKSVAHYLEKVMAAPIKQFAPLNSDDVQGKLRSDGTSIKSYKCSECGKMFRHRSVLELHMRIHSKDKPYQCKVCGKGFRFSSYLQQHVIIHTGKKPYKCPDCGKEFAFLQNMKTHQKLHQEKPFRCNSCRKGYSDEVQLQHHMLSHNGEKPHKCHLCNRSFGLAYLLRDHMNTHTGDRPHRCEECHKSFSWFSSLLVHQKIHARKRQSFSQYNSFPVSTRMRGRGSRIRRGGRLSWGWSRSVGGSGMATSQPHHPYSVSSLRDAEMQRRTVQTHSAMLSNHMEVQDRQQKEPRLTELHTPPVQWKVDGGEVMPVPSSQKPQSTLQQPQFDGLPQPSLQQHHQRGPGWADSPLTVQPGTASVQSLEPTHTKEGPASVVSSLPPAVPKKSSPPIALCNMIFPFLLTIWMGPPCGASDLLCSHQLHRTLQISLVKSFTCQDGKVPQCQHKRSHPHFLKKMTVEHGT